MKKILVRLYIVEAILLLLAVAFFPFNKTFIRFNTAEEAIAHSYHVKSSEMYKVFTYDNIGFYQIKNYLLNWHSTWENFQTYKSETKSVAYFKNTYIQKDDRGWLSPKAISSEDIYKCGDYTVNIIKKNGATILWAYYQPPNGEAYLNDYEWHDSIGSKIQSEETTIEGKKMLSWFVIIKNMPIDYTLSINNFEFRIFGFSFWRQVFMHDFS